MPDRTLVTAPDGRVRKLPAEEFLAMQDTVIIKKDIVYERVETVDKKGNKGWKAGKPTGWKVEQGGYPPLAFGFSNGYFYIKANSDRRWFTDKTDRVGVVYHHQGIVFICQIANAFQVGNHAVH